MMFSHVDYVNFLCYIENRLMKQRNQFVPAKYEVNVKRLIVYYMGTCELVKGNRFEGDYQKLEKYR